MRIAILIQLRLFFGVRRCRLRGDMNERKCTVGMKVAYLEIGHMTPFRDFGFARSTQWKRAACGAWGNFLCSKQDEMGLSRHMRDAPRDDLVAIKAYATTSGSCLCV